MSSTIIAVPPVVGGPVISRSSPEGQFLLQLMSTPAISQNAISQFIVTADATTGGVDVSFQITNIAGVALITLLRAPVNDPAQSTVLQTWAPAAAGFVWSDTDATLKTMGQAYYWIRLTPANTQGSAVTVGPQYLLLNPSLVAPVAAAAISASHGAAANGFVTVTANVSGIPDGESVKIYVTGYLGNPNPVAVAQRATSPLQFVLEASGETVTLKAIVVSSGGTEAATGPTTTLTLNGTATVPAQPQGVTVAQISTGNQITWPASIEAGVTGYQIWVSQRGLTFASATLLATVPATGEGTVEYLDTAGLTGDFQYFIIAVAASGNSSPSSPAYPPILYSSVSLPPNVSGNTSNTATIDSVDTGSSVLVRIYGAGGVGTSYNRLTGYGAVTRPYGSIAGLAYATGYYILYTGSVYLATTTYPPTLPDGYEFVGAVTTTGPTSPSGSGATAVAVLSGGYVVQVTPTAYGSGYLAATVNIAGGGGSGAAATANIVGGQIKSYTVTNGGTTPYTSTPTVTIVPGASGGTTGGGGPAGGPGGSRTASTL